MTRGRPRDRERQESVLVATRDLLRDAGYGQLTVSDVASRAGVTRQLVYRWWPTKQELVADALFGNTASTWPTNHPGPLKKDVQALVSVLVRCACRPEVRSGVLGVIADSGEQRDRLPTLQAGFILPLRESFGGLVEAGQARGDVRPDVDVVMTLDTLRGAVMMQVMDGRRRSQRAMTDHLTEIFVRALEARTSG
jgi:AcrR family transcriptional regulator